MFYLCYVFRGRFTAIAVDWQLYAADRGYYDILFVGTCKYFVDYH
jgi:hypothetical protein